MQVVFRTYVRCISRAQNLQFPIKIEKKDNPTFISWNIVIQINEINWHSESRTRLFQKGDKMYATMFLWNPCAYRELLYEKWHKKVAFFLRLFSQKLIKGVLVDVGLRVLCVGHRGLQNQVY